MSTFLPLLQASPPATRPDWFASQSNSLVFLYTFTCPLACDFCCNDSHPGRTEKASLASALRAVDEAGELGVFSVVAFTGGEPMLYADEVLKIAERAKAAGMATAIASAAHWATSHEDARSLLAPLVAAGLAHLHLSTDPSHERFVPRANVETAAREAVALGVAVEVEGAFYGDDGSIEQFVPGLAGVEEIQLTTREVAGAGRARNRVTHEAEQNLTTEELCCYRRDHHDLTVFPDGTAYPCCSTFNTGTPGIRIGNVFEEGLPAVWERLDGSALFRTMRTEGLGRIIEVCRAEDPERGSLLPEADAPGCVVCNRVFSDEANTRFVHEVFTAQS
jgi:MoaA/NifB/PqqE/SkfB family radical SAM enzyme